MNDILNRNGAGPLPERGAGQAPGPALDLAAWLSQARQVLTDAHGFIAGPVTVIVRGDGHKVIFTSSGTPVVAGVLMALSPREKAIVQAMQTSGRDWLVAKQIAARTHYGNDSTLRAILANLCERKPPVLISGHCGYQLARGIAEPAPVKDER